MQSSDETARVSSQTEDGEDTDRCGVYDPCGQASETVHDNPLDLLRQRSPGNAPPGDRASHRSSQRQRYGRRGRALERAGHGHPGTEEGGRGEKRRRGRGRSGAAVTFEQRRLNRAGAGPAVRDDNSERRCDTGCSNESEWRIEVAGTSQGAIDG